ncbi:hypothetical protein D3C80_2029380 [compost metagenome]
MTFQMERIGNGALLRVVIALGKGSAFSTGNFQPQCIQLRIRGERFVEILNRQVAGLKPHGNHVLETVIAVCGVSQWP